MVSGRTPEIHNNSYFGPEDGLLHRFEAPARIQQSLKEEGHQSNDRSDKYKLNAVSVGEHGESGLKVER